MKYIALLRGINISGKNKIAMSELKKEFTTLGYKEVITYLNSGNVVFESDIEDKTYNEVFDTIGSPNEYEKIQEYKNNIFWSFDLKNYRKSNWWSKTASTEVSNKITIRTANTMRKILEICKR